MAGGAFVQSGGKWGHVGFVEKVNRGANGEVISIEVAESNYPGGEIFARNTIKVGDPRWNKITGFKNPPMSEKKVQVSDMQLQKVAGVAQ